MRINKQLLLSEPFRLFFPLGMLVAVMSVMLWPLYELGWFDVYPSFMHARSLILGFIGIFVLGFLGTAFPRLLGVEGMSTKEFVTVLSLWLGSQGLYFANFIPLGDGVSWLLWSAVIVSALIRLPNRTEVPPPGFVLVAGGLLSLWIALSIGFYSFVAPVVWTGGESMIRSLMYEAFPTLLILGVAPYFFPKIIGGPNVQEFEASHDLPEAWKKMAKRAVLAAALLLVGFVWKSFHVQVGAGIISIALIIYIVVEIPLLPKETTAKGSMAWGLLIGIMGILIGAVGPAIFPLYRIGLFHLLSVAGVSLVLMVVSVRVVHGHAGVAWKTLGRKWWILAISILLPLAGLTRLSADTLPQVRSSHLIYAAFTFAICVGLWNIKNVNLLFYEATDENSSSAPEEGTSSPLTSDITPRKST